MSAEFYLFDVDHGQSAALHLPNGRWCIFDVGHTSSFSPVRWIANGEAHRQNAIPNALLPLRTSIKRPNKFLASLARANAYGSNPYEYGLSSVGLGTIAALPKTVPFRFLKATISHFHGDHLADWIELDKQHPEFVCSVLPDQEYMNDCGRSGTTQSRSLINNFAQYFINIYRNSSPTTNAPDYGTARITEMALSVCKSRFLGGDANSRVNNASIITRIDIYGRSILLCGDMEKDAWDAITNGRGQYWASWRPFLSNIDMLLAPHHGHKSGFSTSLLSLSKPTVVLASVVSRDPHVDSRYSRDPVRGIQINRAKYKLVTTRQKGHIKITINPPTLGYSKGSVGWSFGDAALQ